MKERFKRYLEREFKTITPTKAAMEYRQQMLKQLLDRAQELRIKGINDEDLIYDMVIDELGNFSETLKEFEAKEVKTENAKRKISLAAVISVAVVFLLTLTYLVVGLTTSIWHPTWLIMVGGIFVGIIVIAAFACIKLAKKKKFVPIRILVILCEVLFSVFLFLVMQLVANINGSWMVFLAMVALIAGVDTTIAFGTNNKLKWLELPVFIEIFCVMLYVILGLNVAAVWHPGWLLCLGGVLAGLIECVVLIAKRNKKEEAEEFEKIEKKYQKIDERYWSEWED